MSGNLTAVRDVKEPTKCQRTMMVLETVSSHPVTTGPAGWPYPLTLPTEGKEEKAGGRRGKGRKRTGTGGYGKERGRRKERESLGRG